MNYISDEVLTILVQEVYEQRGTKEIENEDIYNTIKQKFGEVKNEEDFHQRINNCIQNLKSFDPTIKHITVFEDIDFAHPLRDQSDNSSLESDMESTDEDDIKEMEMFTIPKEITETKPERNIHYVSSRRKVKPKKYYQDEESSDDMEKRIIQRASIQEHNREVRLAQAQESEGMKLLRKFTRSSRLGNKGLRGLYNIKDPIEREAELVRRLHEYGETWEGTYPTLKEIRMVSNSTKYYKENLKKQALKNQKLGKKKKKMRKQRKRLYSLSPNSEMSDISD